MRRVVSVFLVIILAFMFSGCATFSSVKEADEFMAAEKAKGIKPVSIVRVGYVLPMDNDNNKSLGLMSDFGYLSLVFLPFLAVEMGAKASLAAKYAATPEEKRWVQAVARTDYGRFVEIRRESTLEKMPRKKPLKIFDKAVKDVGAPPLPCVLVGKQFNTDDGKIKWCVDKEEGVVISYRSTLQYGLVYKTLLPTATVPGQTHALCTAEMAKDHFSKIVKIMEDR